MSPPAYWPSLTWYILCLLVMFLCKRHRCSTKFWFDFMLTSKSSDISSFTCVTKTNCGRYYPYHGSLLVRKRVLTIYWRLPYFEHRPCYVEQSPNIQYQYLVPISSPIIQSHYPVLSPLTVTNKLVGEVASWILWLLWISVTHVTWPGPLRILRK